MSTTVYVVMASEGEYSARVEWVCGVFADPERAKALVEAKQAEARAVQAAGDAYDGRFTREVAEPVWQAPADADKIGLRAELHRAFVAAHGKRPTPEADTFWAVAVPVETWGKWDAWFTPEMPK